MIVGFTVYGPDNGTFMFEDNDALETCPVCGFRIDFFAHNPAYRAKKRRSDLLATYDGQWIVSRRFREVCEQHALPGVQFLSFRDEPLYSHLLLTRIIPFDAERREVDFIKYCASCGNYDEVIGANPAYLKRRPPLEDGFYRTDLLFASGNGKHPVILVAESTKQLLLKEGLKGLDFETAFGEED